MFHFDRSHVQSYLMGMKFHHLVKVLSETGLSPEELAPALGVGSMTIRRWQDEPSSKVVPKAYERSVTEGIYQLMIEGHLQSNSKAVQELLRDATSLSFKAVIKGLGVSDILSSEKTSHQDKMTLALFQIGSAEKRKQKVDSSGKKIHSFKKLGEEWATRISLMLDVIKSKKFSAIDKLVAYGALFYLIFPLDLIPDHIPVIGLIDDFGILGFAVAYYLKKFPELKKDF
jgi:uncharacterized membrane protein YkvA (DUF1232 family)